MGSEKDSESPRSTSLHAAAPDPKCRSGGRRRRLTFHSVFSASARGRRARAKPQAEPPPPAAPPPPAPVPAAAYRAPAFRDPPVQCTASPMPLWPAASNRHADVCCALVSLEAHGPTAPGAHPSRTPPDTHATAHMAACLPNGSG